MNWLDNNSNAQIYQSCHRHSWLLQAKVDGPSYKTNYPPCNQVIELSELDSLCPYVINGQLPTTWKCDMTMTHLTTKPLDKQLAWRLWHHPNNQYCAKLFPQSEQQEEEQENETGTNLKKAPRYGRGLTSNVCVNSQSVPLRSHNSLLQWSRV